MYRSALVDGVALLPLSIKNAIASISNCGKLDLGMAVSTVLFSVVNSVQGIYVVVDPERREQCLQQYFWVLCSPVGGKTEAYRPALRKHAEQQQLRYTRYKKIVEAGGSARLRDILMQDTSPSGLIEMLAGMGESTATATYEGAAVLESPLMATGLSQLCAAWDGDFLSKRRANGRVIQSYSPRYSMLVMLQTEAFLEARMHAIRERAMARGYWQRCFVCVVDPTSSPNEFLWITPRDSMDAYDAIVEEMLVKQLRMKEEGVFDFEAVTFSADAIPLWDQLKSEADNLAECARGHVREAAERLLQKTSRLAGSVSAFVKEPDGISHNTLKASWLLVMFFHSQFEKLFPVQEELYQVPVLTSEQRQRLKQATRQFEDDKMLMGLIASQIEITGVSKASKSDIRTLFLRHAYVARFNAALLEAVQRGEIKETGSGRDVMLSIVRRPRPEESAFGGKCGWNGAYRYSDSQHE